MSGCLHSGKKHAGKLIPLVVVAVLAASVLPLEAQNTGVAGVIKNAAGEPVSGALVKVRSEELGLGFMVVSQAQGRYSTPNLLPGKYAVQAFGGANQGSSSGPLDLSKGQQAKLDIVLNAALKIPPREKRMTEPEDFEKLLPPSKDGMPHLIATMCAECHSVEWILSARKTPEQWRETLDRMQIKVLGNRRALSPLVRPQREQEDPVMFSYLTKFFTPDIPKDPRVVAQGLLRPGSPSHPNRNLPASLLQGATAKYLTMEFSLPAGSAPRDIAVDSQGIAWVSERDSGMLGRFDPKSLTYSRIATPPGTNPKFQLNAVAVDPQDHIWYVDDGPNARFLQYDPVRKEFNSYPIPPYRYPTPDPGWARLQEIGFLNGQVWATGRTSDRIIRLDPTTRRSTHYPVPKVSVPYGLAISNNAVWYSAQVGNAIVKLDPVTGLLSPYTMPTFRSGIKGLAVDDEGNFWAASLEIGKLVSVDHTGKITELALPTEDPGPYAVAVDAKRKLVWFSEVFTDRLVRFDPKTSTYVEYPHPDADSDVRKIQVDRANPNRVWWSSVRHNKIGYIETTE